MKRLFAIILISLAFSSLLKCQFDTIVRYNLEHEAVEYIVPGNVYDTGSNEYTGSQRGTITNFAYLLDEVPANPYELSSFTFHALAANYYNVSDYPISTTIRLSYYKGDTLKQKCSGMLISSDLVLTAAHCVYSQREKYWFDSLIAMPAFDKGKENDLFNHSIASDYFISKSWFDTKGWEDIGIIKLKYPIGIKTGWVGIGYNEDIVFLKNEIFHTFSYPGTIAYFDSTKVFNGDSLYYKYGLLEDYPSESDWLMLGVPGIPGESGSSLIYSDNFNTVYSLGVLNYAFGSLFFKVNKDNFNGLKWIIQNYGSTDLDISDIETDMNIFPVPMSGMVTIESPPLKKIISISIYNQMGVLMHKQNGMYKQIIEINTTNLADGFYLVKVVLEDGEVIVKKVVKG